MYRRRQMKTDFNRSVSKGVTLVDFNAPWCRPCQKQKTILKGIERSFKDSAHVKLVDIDKHRDIALKLGIQSIPTLILYNNGKEMNRFIGLQSRRALTRALKAVIENKR
jgi:thioredoxin 1